MTIALSIPNMNLVLQTVTVISVMRTTAQN